jgi:hypothetical protein
MTKADRYLLTIGGKDADFMIKIYVARVENTVYWTRNNKKNNNNERNN